MTVVWQYDIREDRRGTPGWEDVLAFLRTHGADAGLVPVPSVATVHATPDGGQVLRYRKYEPGIPACPHCDGCVKTTQAFVPVVAPIPAPGWHAKPGGRTVTHHADGTISVTDDPDGSIARALLDTSTEA